ncbi:MAG: alpha-glucosidase/alpha-galactosidase [Lentisphaerae bacterium]|nr:alpha-glucosidase/alpha-galactosidase [Victivallaceae bacterium]NLK84236.1 alpha-glucosidase/alpha-galactosidase [Lentisphaerota bacterium]
MTKIAFMGAGSTVFTKNVIGDCMCRESLRNSHIALYDINKKRLMESAKMLTTLNRNINEGRLKITTHLGVPNRKNALKNADFVVNAIQVGGYEPATVNDFEIPKKYGLRQTIADTLGIGGIFRALRTIPVMLDFAREMEEVCPDAWVLNYTNPMAMLTGAMLRGTSVKTVGLCHSVQVCVQSLMTSLNRYDETKDGPFEDLGYRAKIAGINHMGWLLELTKDGKDIYPEIRKLGLKTVKKYRGGKEKHNNLIRLELMNRFGYYMTESSEHNAEYTPYWIKSAYPELIDEYFIPLDEYPRRCVNQIANWNKRHQEICENPQLDHKLSHEYGSGIMNAIITNEPYQIGGNVLNHGLITNLPDNAVVEVPCLVDSNGVQGTYVGALPPQCAALNMTNINVQLLTIEAALTQKKEHVYHAAMLDPHTSAELKIDDIIAMCDELIDAHGDLLPKYH